MKLLRRLAGARQNPERGDLGLRAVEQIYRSWAVDEIWSAPEARGFAWWGQRHRQRIWADPGYDDEGVQVFRLHAATDLLRDVDADDARTLEVLGVFNSLASLTALTLNRQRGAVELRTSVYVHAHMAEQWLRFFSAAAILQPIEARLRARSLADAMNATPDTSDHPGSGPRAQPDEMLGVLNALYAPAGRLSSAWADSDEFAAVAEMMNAANCCATTEPGSLTLEYPFGSRATSMLLMSTKGGHPLLGNGLIVRLYLPIGGSRSQASRLAEELNRLELAPPARCHHAGAWCAGQKGDEFMPLYACFLPNVLHVHRGLVENLTVGMSLRAHWAARHFRPDEAPVDVPALAARRLREPPELAVVGRVH